MHNTEIIRTEFLYAAKSPIPAGAVQKLATLLDTHPDAALIGVEDTGGRDVNQHDIIIGLEGPESPDNKKVRTDTRVLKNVEGWQVATAGGVSEKVRKIAEDTNIQIKAFQAGFSGFFQHGTLMPASSFTTSDGLEPPENR